MLLLLFLVGGLGWVWVFVDFGFVFCCLCFKVDFLLGVYCWVCLFVGV